MSYIPDRLRQAIRDSSQGRCEYCLFPEVWAGKPHEIDHIIAEKHGGITSLENLCGSCFDCNRHKGSDLCSLDVETGQIVALFNPRQQHWDEHFSLEGASLKPLTPTGRITVRLLQINRSDRAEERRLLISLGHYPI